MAQEFDHDRAHLLLDIVHKASSVGPQLSALVAEAMDELQAMHAALVTVRAERAKKIAEKAAADKAAAAKAEAPSEPAKPAAPTAARPDGMPTPTPMGVPTSDLRRP